MQVRFWDGEKLQQLKSFTYDYGVESASFCPEKDRFVAGGSSMSVHLYDYDTGAELEYYRGTVLSLLLYSRRAIHVHKRTC